MSLDWNNVVDVIAAMTVGFEHATIFTTLARMLTYLVSRG